MIDSLILNNKEKDIFIKLINESKLIHINECKLLYRASKDGWTSFNFHIKCNEKKKTITIIHTNSKNIFGAYQSIKWNKIGKWYEDNNSFLILIRSSKQYKSQIFKLKNKNLRNEITTVYHYTTMGHIFGFGWGHDIRLDSKCNQHYGSYTRSKSYTMPSLHYLN